MNEKASNRKQCIRAHKPCLSIKVKLPEATVRRLDGFRQKLARERDRPSVSRSLALDLLILGETL